MLQVSWHAPKPHGVKISEKIAKRVQQFCNFTKVVPIFEESWNAPESKQKNNVTIFGISPISA